MSRTARADQSDSGDTLIEVRDLSVEFGMSRGRSRVLDNVTLDISREEILGVAGESGSGKSMFASALLDAVVKPGKTSGDITYYPKDSEPVDVLDLDDDELSELRWEHISMVFQGAMSSFNPTLTIRGHFLETLDAHGIGRVEGMKHAHQLLSDLYMEPARVLDSYPHELSGGMKQRALIALSLLLEPEVLVLDEPTASLDLLMQRSILTLLNDLQDRYDLTLVFITHDLPLLTKIADRLAIMYAFEFVEVGTTSEILEGSAHPYTRMLLKSTPNVDAPIEEMKAIEGQSPDPVDAPAGCSYHPRCPLADEQCRAEAPKLFGITETHESACYYWDEAESEIQTTWMGEGKQ